MCLATANQEAGCQITDVQCQCTTGFDTILQSVMSCVPSQCSAEDTAKIAPAVEDICSRAGVTLTSLPTAAPTGTPSGVTDAITGTVTAASSDPSNTNAAGANIAGLGAVALGMAAVLAL
ncbi:hypothetical protein CC78DRAFT_267581 [Lojkania enalia]|uniref:CFEM domain-containing protein n=1 Tax=Lojkania enalia TaxID=147567 RepID=A0A9P4N2W8_9PLEO|nr:hypothetical protein CC78DRAFT_267581 [Didymosphaeria enalia]